MVKDHLIVMFHCESGSAVEMDIVSFIVNYTAVFLYLPLFPVKIKLGCLAEVSVHPYHQCGSEDLVLFVGMLSFWIFGKLLYSVIITITKIILVKHYSQ